MGTAMSDKSKPSQDLSGDKIDNPEQLPDEQIDFYDPFARHFVSSNTQNEYMRWLDDAPFESGTIH